MQQGNPDMKPFPNPSGRGEQDEPEHKEKCCLLGPTRRRIEDISRKDLPPNDQGHTNKTGSRNPKRRAAQEAGELVHGVTSTD